MQVNQVKYYDATTAITTTPATVFTLEPGYNMLEVQNDTNLDIIVTFGTAKMLIKTDTKKIQSFRCDGVVTVESAGSSAGNFFIQCSVG